MLERYVDKKVAGASDTAEIVIDLFQAIKSVTDDAGSDQAKQELKEQLVSVGMRTVHKIYGSKADKYKRYVVIGKNIVDLTCALATDASKKDSLDKCISVQDSLEGVENFLNADIGSQKAHLVELGSVIGDKTKGA